MSVCLSSGFARLTQTPALAPTHGMSVCLSSGFVCCHPHTNTCTGTNAIHRRKRALSDKKVLGNAYRAVSSRAPEHRVSLTCTDCGEVFSACVATPPADAAWACEACDSVKPELTGVLGGSWVGSVEGARGGGRGHIAPLDCARIESEWLRFHADETRHLRDVGKRVQTIKDLAAELAAEQKTADVALAEAEKRHAALGQRKFDLANKKMRLLDLVRRVAGADAVRVHRETAAAAAVAAETQAAAERAAAAFLAAAGQNPTTSSSSSSSSSSAAAADAASADAHGAAAAATAGGALPMRFPALKLLPEQTALHSVSATMSDGAALMTYSPQPYSSAPLVSSASAAAAAAAAAATAYQYASTLPRLVSYPSLVASMEGYDVDGHDGDAMDIDLTPLPQPTPNGVGAHSTSAGNGAAQRAYGGVYHEP
jgi:hypothetical protein